MICIPSFILLHSTIRQIPDHQEVWLEKDSDMSLIIELLETPTDPKDLAAFSVYPPTYLNMPLSLFCIYLGSTLKSSLQTIQRVKKISCSGRASRSHPESKATPASN